MAEQAETMVRRWVEEGLNQGKLDVIDELYAPTFKNHSQPDQPIGPAGVKQGVTELRTAFSDFHVTIDDLFACGDRVVWMYTGRGTHSGDLAGVAASGRAVEYHGIVMARLADGRFVEGRGVVDMLPFLQQLGLFSPAP